MNIDELEILSLRQSILLYHHMNFTFSVSLEFLFSFSFYNFISRELEWGITKRCLFILFNLIWNKNLTSDESFISSVIRARSHNIKQHADVKATVFDTTFNEKSFSNGQPKSGDGQKARRPAMQHVIHQEGSLYESTTQQVIVVSGETDFCGPKQLHDW